MSTPSKFRVWDGFQMYYTDIASEEHPSMRSTGLFDFRGKEIYECDILYRAKPDGERQGTVEYDQFTDRFQLRRGIEVRTLGESTGYAVWGNAFEHPSKA